MGPYPGPFLFEFRKKKIWSKENKVNSIFLFLLTYSRREECFVGEFESSETLSNGHLRCSELCFNVLLLWEQKEKAPLTLGLLLTFSSSLLVFRKF